MQFKKLKIGSKNLKKQQLFYQRLLGFPVSSITHNKLVIDAGATQLIFSNEINTAELYHYAFLIPTGSLEACINFIELKGIDLLPFKGEKIVHFDTGRSIYFLDPDDNIAEFIERPMLHYPAQKKFTIGDVICINEIGHPVKNPLSVSEKLMIHHGIQPINHKIWNDNFCWVGDHEGAVIVVKEGRNWLPTKTPSVFNDFELEYIDNGLSFHLKISGGKIASSKF